jgi:hypothetical protein
VHKGSTQTNKRTKLVFKRKEQKKPKSTLVWRTEQCPVPRAARLQTCHLRVSEEPLCYNSPDCLVCHRTVRCTSGATASQSNGRLQRSSDNAQCADSSRRVRAATRRRTGQWTVPVRCGTGLSGATRRQSSNVETVRTLTVGWCGWRTGHCPVCPSTAAYPNGWIGGWGL